MRIGITLGLANEHESLWTNGIKQNAVYLAETLKQVEGVRSVRLLNTTGVPVTQVPWDTARWPTAQLVDAKDDLDVLVELGGQVDAAMTEYLKARGTRLVSYCCGCEYVLAMQSMLFNRRVWGPNVFVNPRYDALWVIPQVADTSLHFFQTLRRLPAQVVPFVWDPVFLEQRAQDLDNAGRYRTRPGAKRLTVIEPNNDVVKFCMYPVLAAEEAYRREPRAIERLHVANAEALAQGSEEFVGFMSQLDLVREHKASFIGRYETPQLLAALTDIVVSNQWDNPLNYLYLEVCWQGYPLVHNAPLCADLGYFYPGNDVVAAADQILRAARQHDAAALPYLVEQRRLIARFLPTAPAVTRRYGELLQGVMSAPLR